MRNWNSGVNSARASTGFGFQTTYEELKLSELRTNVLSPRSASRLPMRNWNYDWRSGAVWWRGLASRLPMRNWNLRNLDYFPYIHKLPDYLWGIETRHGYLTVAPIFGFQTTYEELKLSSTSNSYTGWFASRLPMRNWNCLLHQEWVWKDGASRLPMRNWNLPFSRRTSRLCRASRLPMRNWNYNLLYLNCAAMQASRLPMRNWNLVASEDLASSSRFQTTYEELKLCNIGDMGSSNIASRLPMRNWNSLLHLLKHLWIRFQTTYEELKLGNSRP